MAEKDSHNKEIISGDVTFKGPSSPRVHNKKEKTKYQAFHSGDEESSDEYEFDGRVSRKKMSKKDRNAFKVKIKGKGKKKEKEKEREKEKEKERDKDKEKEREKDKPVKDKPDKKEKRSKSKGSVMSGDEAPPEKVDQTPPLHGPVFGQPLHVAVERSKLPDGIPLPRVVRECIRCIEERGLCYEGIYRVSGVRSKMDQLKQLYNEGREVSLEDVDPHCVASLLKLFLREMPASVLTTRLAPIFDACVGLDDDDEQLRRYQQLVNDLPVPNKTLLAWLFVHFRHIMEKGSETKMNIQNLSIVFSPTMSISHGVLNIFFCHIDEIFGHVELMNYDRPKILPNSTCSEPSIEELQEMLQRDEETLQKLHDSVNQQTKGQDDDLHEELWEMQRKVTQTKRKIKSKRREQKIYEQSQSQDDISPRSQSPPVDPAHNESQSPTSSHQPNLVVTVSTTKSHDTTGKTPEDTLLMKSSTSMSKQEPSTPDTAAKEEKCGSSSKPTLKEIASSVDAKKVKSKAPIAPAWVAQIVVTNENKEIKDSVDKTVAVPIETIHRESSKEKDEILSGTVTNEEVKLEIYQAGESDEEFEALLLEERELIIEQEELLTVGESIRKKIKREKLLVDRLEVEVQQYTNNKHDSSSTSASSINSSSSSIQSIIEKSSDSEIELDEDNSELEKMLQELEKENEWLQAASEHKIKMITNERQQCVALRTKIRMMAIRCR